ncbi:hypothetical protein K7432_004421 [Basidiobolus ranarum]|uniref:Uncharacterized protein n=1 Tax=Basidiobolus ranarum TaxID=34480 RepID=A0ABR2WY91_9FUNG
MDEEHAATLLAEKFTPPSRTQRSASVTDMNPSADRESVQAYAKLEGVDFSHYIRALQVTLGRIATSSENADITLSAAKSISRLHAKVYYNFLNQRFELLIQGKNGAFINDQFVEKGATVPLEHGTKIQIGEIAFHFLLPRSDNNMNTLTATPAAKTTFVKDYSNLSSSNQSNPETLINADESSRDEYFNVKPPYSYASLIAQAINSTTLKKMTLNGIYNYITSHYPYYQLTQNGWQNSIRHNLSLNKAFVKVPRSDGEPGKGAFWTIDQNYEAQFSNGVYKRSRRSSKTSREGSASPFPSPVKSRKTNTTSAPGEPNSLLSSPSEPLIVTPTVPLLPVFTLKGQTNSLIHSDRSPVQSTAIPSIYPAKDVSDARPSTSQIKEHKLLKNPLDASDSQTSSFSPKRIKSQPSPIAVNFTPKPTHSLTSTSSELEESLEKYTGRRQNEATI